jgi:hypothetical protein
MDSRDEFARQGGYLLEQDEQILEMELVGCQIDADLWDLTERSATAERSERVILQDRLERVELLLRDAREARQVLLELLARLETQLEEERMDRLLRKERDAL